MNRTKLFLYAFLLIIITTRMTQAMSLESGKKAAQKRPAPSVESAAMSFTPCVAGMAGPYPCDKIDLLAFMPLSTIGCNVSGNGNVVEGWVDSTTNKEYALFGCDTGASIIDVTDPLNPIYIGKLPAHSAMNSLWRDIRVYNDRMYVGSDNVGAYGIQVFDLTRVRTAVPPATFTEDARYAGLGNSHTIFINKDTGFLYAVGSGGTGNVCKQGMHMINIQDLQPTFAGCHGNGIYTHETTCYTYSGPDATYTGHEICFDANGPTQKFEILDVTDKANSVQLANKTYVGAEYPHQIWLTEDQHYALLDDELDEEDFGHALTTYIWDISDLNNPILISSFAQGTNSIDHNQYVMGNYVYQSDYQAGIRIFDLNNIASGQLNLNAFFDVWPYGDDAQFEGTWDNYPYLPSGILLATGIFNPGSPNPPNVGGLFILQPHLTPDFSVFANDDLLNACGTGSAGTTITLSPLNQYTGNVNMSASGLPAGASAAFTPNPAAVPGDTSLTVTLSGTAAGNYPFTITASDGVNSHDEDLTLNVATVALTGPSLLEPANGATNQPFIIHYEWDPIDGASSYDLEIATDAGFSNIVYTKNTVEDHHTATLTLLPSTIYFWHVRANNACGAGNFSPANQLTTGVPAHILLVDDDNDDPDVVSYYTDMLNSFGETYNIWTTATQTVAEHLDEPTTQQLELYPIVIWFSGDADTLAGPSVNSEDFLPQYLNNGGCLILSSQDYFKSQGGVVTPFMQNYLGVSSIVENAHHINITGTGIFSGTGTLSLIYPSGETNSSDRVLPDTANGAQAAFNGNQGVAAISKDGGAYRTVFMGFPLEAVLNSAARNQILTSAIDYCNQLSEPDVAINQTDAPDPVPVGSNLTYTITVDNNSTVQASNVTVSDTLNGSTFVSATPSQGTCSGTTTVSCNLGTLSGNTSATITLVVTPSAEGTLSNTASVSSDETDRNTANNTSTTTTLVVDACLYCDDFEDGIMPNWDFQKGTWTEAGGNLTATGKKNIAFATPAFGGCSTCSFETTIQIDNPKARLVIFSYYTSHKAEVELKINPKKGEWLLKQHSNGKVVAKAKANHPFAVSTNYSVRIAYDGTNLQVFVDGTSLMSVATSAAPSGTIGFQAKKTTLTLGDVIVN